MHPIFSCFSLILFDPFTLPAPIISAIPLLAFGLFMCRGDIIKSTLICEECVVNASTEIRRRCPVEKEATIWYDKCMLHYSGEPIYSVLGETTPTFLPSSNNARKDNDSVELLWAGMINTLAAKAASSPKKFAATEEVVNSQSTLYGLVQCTPDLSASDCRLCFQRAIAATPICCKGRGGGRVLLRSCNIRYEFHRFFDVAAAIAIPPPATNDITSIQSLQFDFKSIETATSKFSDSNKLGKGGFGEVYKGILVNGREIAVKRLSKSSGQGTEEFKNEVVLVAKLQHRNLVRLCGFCLEGEEKILVYEYVPNKSLDYFLFDPQKQGELDWSKRHKIIGGIARGILYLHEDSRLRVIHRDLKASNILLDAELNPKVSDFGMARMFGIDQTEGNTARIVGTYGYMAPEYAMEGLYSIKSDVFSFGVLLLEILSGRKNSGFYLTEFGSSLLIYAWNLWNEGKVMELMDPSLKQSCAANEFMRYVHIGLLCVQEDAYDRPTMSSVVLMLTTETISLSKPQRPAFSVGRNIHRHHQLGPDSTISDNVLTISTFVPR
ncbi:hypothetical protein FNV43_RR07750 [Rhamnella rubrinervis]|uniref:Cysteine-rich receptor-like protein kinase 10 n=1 Tax=Rhamnella rubrinervis TaxID=2594499 RepID=A0A8K0MMQ3_9ROSA|nr:hypothetical protein FNV43_RR07750 [Rhamnella rubrinervis]